MKYVISTAVFVLSVLSLSAQVPEINWGIKLGMNQTSSIPSFAEGYQTVTDGSGNIYTAGVFSGGTSDLDSSATTVVLASAQTNSGFATEDIFITKHSPSGSLLWARKFGAEYVDRALAIATDGFNVYVTGSFSGTVDFDPTNGTTNVTGANDVFILKLNSSGNLVWIKTVGGNTIDQGNSIDVDQSGSVVITGTFSGTADFDPALPTQNLTSAGGSDVFILKLDNTGGFMWVKQLVGDADDYPAQIVLDNNNNVLVTGNFSSNNIDLDPGNGFADMTNNGGNDIFWLKLNSNGDFVAGRSIGSNANDYGYGIAADGIGGIYCIGTFAGNNPVDFGNGNMLTTTGYNDTYMMRMDTVGNIQWLKSISGTSTDNGRAITLDMAANIYVTGYFLGSTDFDMDSAQVFLDSDPGGEDMFVAKYNNQGNYLWARKVGGANSQNAYSIALDPNGDLITTGEFALEINLDSSMMYNSGPPNCIGDVFILKLSQPVITTGVEESDNSFVNVYPNPSSNYIVFESENVSEIFIYSVLGKLILTQKIMDAHSFVDVNTWASGVYFIQTNTGKTIRFIKS